MNQKFFLVLSIPLLLSGCYLPTAIRINRNILVKKTRQALEKCGVNLKNIIIESNQMNSLTHPIKKDREYYLGII